MGTGHMMRRGAVVPAGAALPIQLEGLERADFLWQC